MFLRNKGPVVQRLPESKDELIMQKGLLHRRYDLGLMVDVQIVVTGIEQLINLPGARSRIQHHIGIPGQAHQL